MGVESDQTVPIRLRTKNVGNCVRLQRINFGFEEVLGASTVQIRKVSQSDFFWSKSQKEGRPVESWVALQVWQWENRRRVRDRQTSVLKIIPEITFESKRSKLRPNNQKSNPPIKRWTLHQLCYFIHMSAIKSLFRKYHWRFEQSSSFVELKIK